LLCQSCRRPGQLVFDGNSTVFDYDGEIIHQRARLREGLIVVDLDIDSLELAAFMTRRGGPTSSSTSEAIGRPHLVSGPAAARLPR